MQDSWLRKKADEIQSFADRKDMKKSHNNTLLAAISNSDPVLMHRRPETRLIL